VSDLFMPLTGTITEINPVLDKEPEKVNTDPYGDGWMIKLKISDNEQVKELLDAGAYEKLVS
jgi:glycine cleavage system H protein